MKLKRTLAALTALGLAFAVSTNITQPILAAPANAPPKTAATTEKAEPTEVYCLVVAADFNGDGEKKLKEYFEFYKTSVEKYLGDVLIYEWHYYSQDKIPKSLKANIVDNWGGAHNIYKACMEIFGQKYWQRVLISYDMEGGLIAPQALGYADYTVDQYVDLAGFGEKQLGIHGECHVLESHIETLNGTINKSDPKNWTLEPNEKLQKFWLENGWCHYVVQKDVDRYAKQYGHEPIKWNDPKWKEWQADYKRDGKLVNVEKEGTVGDFYTKNPQGVYWYGMIGGISYELFISRQHELETMQRLQQEFGITLASITPLHAKAKVPKAVSKSPIVGKSATKKEQ